MNIESWYNSIVEFNRERFSQYIRDRMTKRALRALIERRAKDAGIPPPGLHDFRRGFALMMWRNGVDILTISRLMGHSTIDQTRRYIAPFDDDLRLGHAKGSPGDRWHL